MALSTPVKQFVQQLRFGSLFRRNSVCVSDWETLSSVVPDWSHARARGPWALASELLFHADFGLPDPPIFGVVISFVYAIAANVCYTGSWIVELIFRRLWPRKTDGYAVWTFSLAPSSVGSHHLSAWLAHGNRWAFPPMESLSSNGGC